MIHFACPHCGKRYQVEPQHGGKETTCRECGGAITIPPAGESPDAEPIEINQDMLAGGPAPSSPPTPQTPPTTPEPIDPRLTGPISGLAIASLTMSIVGFCFAPLAIAGLICGIVAMNKTGSSGRRGYGVALAGTVVGAVAIVIGLLVGVMMLGILLPALGAARKTANRAKNQTQVRLIVQEMTVYAAANSDQLPGLDANGNLSGPTTAERFETLFNQATLAPEVAINPVDTGITLWTGGSVTQSNYSYAMLRIDRAADEGRRKAMWRANYDTLAPWISDRNTSTTPGQTSSVWQPYIWEGAIGWGDGHASHMYGPDVTTSTQQLDNLFEDAGSDDAYMSYD